MPIYEYQCNACGYAFESLQKVSDDTLKDCPECNEPELRKLVSAAGFRLKGSGWYETDFKHKGKEKKAADTNADSKSSDTKPDSSKNSKKTASVSG